MEDFSLPVARTTPGLRSVTAGLYGEPMRGARRRQGHDETPHSPRTSAFLAEPDDLTRAEGLRTAGRHRPNRRSGRWLAITVVALLAVAIPGGALYGLRWVHDHPHTMITFGDDHGVPARSSRDHTRTVAPSPTGSPTPSPSASGSAAPTATDPVESVSAYEREVVREINAARARSGCPALRYDSRLATAARAHSDDMAARGYFDHTSPDGVTPWDRAKAAGYAQPSAENIAAGQATPAAAVTAWLNSPGHRANILNCSSRATGVGFAQGGKLRYYWTELFGYQ
jgi:uncharacterized protein YkwD